MSKQVSASDTKNNLGGLLENVAALAGGAASHSAGAWGETHMIPPELARAARMLGAPGNFDEDSAHS